MALAGCEVRTWFCQRNKVSNILHEYAALELKLWLALGIYQSLVRVLVLGLGEINVLAAQQDGFEQIHVIL